MNQRFYLSAACLALSLGAFAQVAPPDAGQVLRDNSVKKVVPSVNPPEGLLPKSKGESKPAIPGGPQVAVGDVRFEGNTVFSQEELKAVLGDKLGRRYDLAGMKQLAELVTAYYRERGYPFAKALVPVQEFDDGVLRLRVLEGRYASVQATGPQYEIEGAAPFIARLRRGELIYGPELESAMLILDDVPGIDASPTVSPGAKLETADLSVAVRLAERRGSDLTVDNHGSRFTGRYRLRGQHFENSLFAFGDRTAIDFIGTNHEMVLGSLSYERPWGGQGLKAELSFSNTAYILGEDYAAMGISGLARVWSAKLAYPLVRSQAKSLYASVSYQHKALHDNFPVLASVEDKSSDLLVAALRFDVRDGFAGGGLTYGMLTSTYGNLTLDRNQLVSDAVTARKAGGFGKLSLDIARMQSLVGGLTLYVHGTAQWTDGNLDSSEKMGAGGADGVRAYPLGEGSGDVGWLAQIELRAQAGDHAPYLFYDACRARANRHAWDVNSAQVRRLAGAGVGVRSAYGKWSSDLSIAWRTEGGVAQSDGSFGGAVGWFSLGRSF